jgi:tetratricopeptide (TPR) repeat protein
MDVTSRFWKGLSILLVEGDWNRANQQAREILEINPRYPAGFPYFAGPCKDWMDGEMSAARSGYWNILESTFPRLGPIFQVGIRQFIARFFFFNGETDLTLKLLETSEWMVPRLSDEIIANHHQLERSFVYQELGDINTSLNLLKQASESNQGIRKVESLGWLGILLAKQGDFSGAEKARKQLLEDETELSVGFFAPPLPREKKRAQNAFSEQILGEIANSKGENDRAVSHFLEVLRLVPPRGSTFLSALNPRLFLTANESLAAIYTRTGEVEKGIEALRAILRNKGLIATTAAAGRIWLRALNSIIPLLVENGQETEARESRGYLEQIQQSS